VRIRPLFAPFLILKVNTTSDLITTDGDCTNALARKTNKKNRAIATQLQCPST
jgi:hypothetical protein